MDGLILIDKPQALTSHDIVLEIRKTLHIQKIGHFGTLDPLATGLLIIAIGKATKLFPFFSKEDKIYRGRIRLGFSTDTYDSLGKPISLEKQLLPDKEKILLAMEQFRAEVRQIPPPFSAKKYRGKPLYKLARGKREFQLKPCTIFIHYFELKSYEPPFLDFEVKCSSGTYIRSIAHDLGQSLGCGAHLSELTRTDVGNFRLADSFTLKKIKTLAEKGEFESFLIPLESLLPKFPKVILNETGATLTKNGSTVFPENILKVFPCEPSLSDAPGEKEMIFRLFSLEGKLLALAKRGSQKKSLCPFLVIN